MSQQGVLLVNLGSPDSTSVRDVRRYLAEFLMDKRVLDIPYPTRLFVVYGCILPFRPKQSAEAYERIWTDEGSPLIVISRKVHAQLAQRVPVPVELAMRYQNPSIEDGLTRLLERKVDEVFLVPLFPHYAMSSYETAVERVRTVLRRLKPNGALKVARPYFDDADYIDALVTSAEPSLSRGYDHLLFSFHGIPERQLRKSDPTGRHCLQVPNCCDIDSSAHLTCYRAQCFRTMRAFVAKAGIAPEKYSIAFQSRLGRDPWLRPYTDHELERLARAGVKQLAIICPAFVSDCLETLEEIGIRGRETFEGAGGEELILVPCLNDHPSWLRALERIVVRGLETDMEPVPGR